MKQCQLLENEKSKVKRIIKVFTLCTIIIFIIIIFLILKLYKFDFKVLNKLNWEAITSVATVLTLIGTVIISKNELIQNTKNQIMATELEKFKENLNNEINKYIEFSNQLFEHLINLDVNRPDIISTNDINKILILINRYKSFIGTIIENINYYYGNINNERIEYNNFINELLKIKIVIYERLNYFLNLTQDMNNLNLESIKVYFSRTKENPFPGELNDLYNRAKKLVDNFYIERNKLMISNEDIIRIKQLALNVVEERKNYIEKNLNRIYKF